MLGFQSISVCCPCSNPRCRFSTISIARARSSCCLARSGRFTSWGPECRERSSCWCWSRGWSEEKGPCQLDHKPQVIGLDVVVCRHHLELDQGWGNAGGRARRQVGAAGTFGGGWRCRAVLKGEAEDWARGRPLLGKRLQRHFRSGVSQLSGSLVEGNLVARGVILADLIGQAHHRVWIPQSCSPGGTTIFP